MKRFNGIPMEIFRLQYLLSNDRSFIFQPQWFGYKNGKDVCLTLQKTQSGYSPILTPEP